MIWALAREQLRAQRRYAISAGALIAITVGIAVFGVLMASTMASTAKTIEAFEGPRRETSVEVSLPQDMTHDELAAGIDAANAEGHSVVANIVVPAALPGAEGMSVLSYYGDVNWDARLVEGAAPGPGQIAVAANWANDNGVEIGDAITLEIEFWTETTQDPVVVPLEPALIVSGMAQSSVSAPGMNIEMPFGYVSWDDAPSFVSQSLDEYHSRDQGTQLQPPEGWSATVSGNGNWLWINTLTPAPEERSMYSSATDSAATAYLVISAIGVGLLLAGIMATAFALGRAQAQVRSRWVATARALGATRGQIITATGVEAALIGVVAGGTGYVLGAAAAAVHVGRIKASTEGAVLTWAGWFSPLIALGAIVLALVLSLIIGAIPAFWAARVQPAAALKPVTDLTEAEASRRVNVKPLAMAWFASLAVLLYAATVGVGGPWVLLTLVAAIVLLVGGIMLAHEVLRATLPWHAQRLAQSPRTAVMVAGDSILARPRQSTIPAFIAALATCGLIGIFAPMVAADGWQASTCCEGGISAPREFYYASISIPIFLAVFAIVTLMCVSVGAATATLTARETAAREALGLSRRAARTAAAVQYLVAQSHGMLLGLGAGLLVAAFLIPNALAGEYALAASWLPWELVLCAAVLACGASWALIGAALVAALTPATAPLAKLEAAA